MGKGWVQRVVVGVAVAVALTVVGVPAASAEGLEPWWHVSSGARPSYLAPGGEGTIVATVLNVGETSTSIENASHEPTPVRIVDRLPPGLEAVSVEGVVAAGTSHGSLQCEHTASEAVCAVEDEEGAPVAVAPFDPIEVRVAVVVQPGATTCEPDASACESNVVGVSGGGGAAESHPVSVARPVTISAEPAPFGVEDYEMTPEQEGGQLDTQAGSHPFQTTFAIGFNQTAQTRSGNGSVAANPVALTRDLRQRFPAGLIADPRAVARCGDVQFEAEPNACPADSVVGVAVVTASEPGHVGVVSFPEPIFNLVPSRGEPARFGFLAHSRETPVYVYTSVRSGGDYGITAEVSQVSQAAAALSVLLTFWGVPGAGEHNETRDGCLLAAAANQAGHYPCEPSFAETDPPPFLALPASCSGGPLQSSVEADSWEHPGNFATGERVVSAAAQPSLTLDGCDQLPFAPEISVAPERAQASTPSAFDVDVRVPQAGGEDPAAAGPGASVANADIRDMTIALPAGVALNPAGAEGLEACSEGLVGFTGFQALDPEVEPGAQTATFTPMLPEPLQPGVNFCPTAAKVGTVKISTPILAKALEGAVYLAAQNANPFGSLVALYIVAKDPESGVLVKLAGDASLDSQTGQIVVTFQNDPQLPFEDVELDFFGEDQAPLSTPARCGPYTTQASFVPWSATLPAPSWEGPNQSSSSSDEAALTVHASSTFDITSGPDGGPCPGASLPFAPSFTAGVANIDAGSFSPLTVTVSRADGQQAIQSVRLRLPPGLLGVLAGVPLCPEAQANPGTCGPESLIGETTLSAGLGGKPVTIAGGRVYLTGPYDGAGPCTPSGSGWGSPSAEAPASGCAPFGLSIAVPARVGPFELQEGRPVVVRAKLEVDPTNAALTIVTNGPEQPYHIPSIVEGFPLQIKDLNITIGRPGFMFNPTSCAPLQITGTIDGDEGASVPVSDPFRMANCAALKFAPKLAASTRANGEAVGHGASLRLGITTGTSTATANIAKLKMDLPKQLPTRLTTLQRACRKAVFAADPANCPASSVVGTAKVATPVLGVPMAGPAYFVSNGRESLPDLDIVLQGDGVRLNLRGSTFVSQKNVTSVSFRSVPDIPLRDLEIMFPEGTHSALGTETHLCKQRLAMPTAVVAQNGAEVHTSIKVAVSGCAKPRKAKFRKRRKAR